MIDTTWEAGFAAGVAWSEERDRLISNMQEWSCHQPVNADYGGKIERAHALIAEHMEKFKEKLQHAAIAALSEKGK